MRVYSTLSPSTRRIPPRALARPRRRRFPIFRPLRSTIRRDMCRLGHQQHHNVRFQHSPQKKKTFSFRYGNSRPEDKRHLTAKMLPKRPARILRGALDTLCLKCIELKRQRCNLSESDDDFQEQKKEQRLQLEIQVAFLRFMASILKGYRSFLLPITKQPTVGATDMKSLFDIQGFLKTRDRAYHKFYHHVTATQMFIRFIEERSFVSDMDAGLAFFDECIEKVEADDCGGRLLEIEDNHKSERTVFIAPPEPTDLPEDATYSYNVSFKKISIHMHSKIASKRKKCRYLR